MLWELRERYSSSSSPSSSSSSSRVTTCVLLVQLDVGVDLIGLHQRNANAHKVRMRHPRRTIMRGRGGGGGEEEEEEEEYQKPCNPRRNCVTMSFTKPINETCIEGSFKLLERGNTPY